MPEPNRDDDLLPIPHRGRSLQDYLRILVKRRWAALTVFFAIVITAALYTFTTTPIYKATVQLLIERHLPRLLDSREGAQHDYFQEEFYQTQYKLLESRALAKRVADKLQLKKHPSYAAMFQEKPGGPPVNPQSAEEALVGAVQGGIEVTPIRNSRLVDVSFYDPDPRFAAQAVNALAQCYIEHSLELRFAASQEATVWLRQKLEEARKKLEESENKLNAYKKQHGIIATEDKETITAQKLEQLNRELVSAQTRRMEAETRFKEVSAGRPIPQVLSNPLITTLKAEEAKIINQISELSKKFGEKHPRMIQLQQEMAALRAKIGAELAHIRESIKNEYAMAKSQEAQLLAALQAVKGETQDLGERTIQYRVLLRDVESNRAMYENMLKSLKETTATENLPSTNIRIVYPAAVPEAPVKPNKRRNLMLALVLGAVLGVAAALGLESLDSTLKTPEDVEGWLEIPNLAMIPHLELAPDNPGHDSPELVVHRGQPPLALEAYLGLRTSILFSTPEQAPHLLLVSSTLPLEGKTLTAANLATAMAKAENPILLVDADLRRPTLHQLFRVEREPGLTNFLVGETDDLPVRETAVPQLYVLPCGKIPPNPSELLGSARMREFCRRAREHFARVIVDSPPLLSVTDPAILATMADGVLLVVKAESVPRRAALEARDQLLEVKAPLLGAILNDVPFQRDGYYYQQYYRYYSYYGRDEDGAQTPRPRRTTPTGGFLAGLKKRWRKSRRSL
ncbi:MAG: polysaccharide biosynthesis tyrosine autokinase [Deltaproteobacteria bacterium]|nr:polysaccharide biosynthesis tyrosine autokinase [Deltaproteobacteria bacterium]MBM4286872.1 polysaccharide biosynthesis tyrosine autokinase [Deltaproteobacteria bacterium]